jgi:hypothetical protein
MLESLTEASFAPYVGTEFRIHIDASTAVSAELVEVTARPKRTTRVPWDTGEPRREPFSIVFRGPLDRPLLQQMYTVEHETIGIIEGLFLVPVGINRDGRFYEAVFS